jgi:integrase
VLVGWSQHGFAETSVRRTRNSLSFFFAWAVRERLIVIDPVTATHVPRSHTPRTTEMYPFGEDDLERLWERASEIHRRLADLVLLAAWTGLRWSELRAIRVRDFVEVPMVNQSAVCIRGAQGAQPHRHRSLNLQRIRRLT